MSEAITKAQTLENLISISNMHADDAAWLRAALSQPAPLAGEVTDEQIETWSFWEQFPGYLIDNHEGDILTEEMLQHAASGLHAKLKAEGRAILALRPQAVPMTPEQRREHFTAGYEAAEQDATVCQVPPHGWHCTRKAGHKGPCAAVENDDASLVQRGMDRLRGITAKAEGGA